MTYITHPLTVFIAVIILMSVYGAWAGLALIVAYVLFRLLVPRQDSPKQTHSHRRRPY